MGVAKAISRATVNFSFDDMDRAALARALGPALRPKLEPRKQAPEEKAPGWGKETGETEGVGDEAGGKQQGSPHGEHHPLQHFLGGQGPVVHAPHRSQQRCGALLAQERDAEDRGQKDQGDGGKGTDGTAHFDKDNHFDNGDNEEKHGQHGHGGLRGARRQKDRRRTMGAGPGNLKRRPVNRVADSTDSFELDPKARLYLCLAAVAEGTVISYGALAAQAGVPRGARWAGRELRQLPQGSALPWHRVLRSDGFLALPGSAGDRQRKALLAEGHHLKATARGWRLVPPIAWSPYA